MIWLIVDVLLNGRIRDITYTKLQEYFSFGWERFRIIAYLIFALLIFLFFTIYFIVPDILTKRKLENEKKKLINFVTELYQKDSIIDVPEEYAGLYNIITIQKNSNISSEYKKNEMISNIAHDLRTPLTSVLGYLMILNDENNLSKETEKKYINICFTKAEQINSLINEFFEYTQNTESNMILSKQRIDITELLEQIADEMYPLSENQNKNIRLNYNSPIILLADSSKLARAFENIIKNALNYSIDEEIIINVSEIDNKANITVSNKCDFISLEDTERIFERSYRLDKSRTSNGNSGLGLSIAKEIIEAHNGKICAVYENERINIVSVLPLYSDIL